MRRKISIKKYYKQYLISAVLLFSCAIILSFPFFLFHGIIVKTVLLKDDSMNPVLKNGELIISSAFLKNYGRNDIVILRKPENTADFIAQRIIGLPGDKIKIFENQIYVNDVLMMKNFVMDLSAKILEFNLAKDEYFVIGDNITEKPNSALLNPIKVGLIEGKYLFGIK